MRTRIAVAILGLFAVCPQVRAQKNLILLPLDKLPLIRVANPGALSMPGMAMPTTFPNNYASTITATYDPSVGSQGTIYLSYNFTGTTSSGNTAMCNSGAQHIAKIGIQVVNAGVNKSFHYAQGTGVPPCVELNQTLIGCTPKKL